MSGVRVVSWVSRPTAGGRPPGGAHGKKEIHSMLSYLHAMLFRRAVFGRGKPKSASWRSEAPGARSRPTFDCLEDRTVPSTLGTQVATLAGQAATLTQDAMAVDHGLYFLD